MIDGVEIVNCPVCGASPIKIWMEDGKLTHYVKCGECGTIYASPRAPYSVRSAWLDSTFGLGENAFQNADSRREALAQEANLLKYHVNGGRFLDVGCDLGHFFQWFPDPSWERYGVEISPSAAEFAAKTYSAKVHIGTIKNNAYPEAFFDLVTMLDMLYYVDDPQSDFHEIHRILKPGGKLAIEIPGQGYQLLRSRGIVCWLLEHRWTRFSSDSSYINWISPSGLRRLLKSCGYEIRWKYIINSPTSSLAWRNFFSKVHNRVSKLLIKWSFQSLTWAPKYMVIAQK